MALIQCPHCGERVSDTVERCIHCGKPIKEMPPKPKNYVDFSYAEREVIVSEFERQFPKYNFRRVKKRNRRLWGLFTVIFIVITFYFIGCLILTFQSQQKYEDYRDTHGIHTSGPLGEYEYRNYWIEYTDTDVILWTQEEHDEMHRLEMYPLNFVLVGAGIFWLTTHISFITILICYIKNTKKYLLHYKIFTKWLLIKKSITFQPILSPRQKNIFNKIDIEKYKI